MLLFLATTTPRSFTNIIRGQYRYTCTPTSKMSSGISQVNDWLRKAQTSIRKGGKLGVYLGNESCDLDSVVSPLALAYASNDCGVPAIPILNVRRAELRLRRDVVNELENAGVDSSLIPCTDDTSVEEILSRGGGLTLVDHNELAGHQSKLGQYVTAIVDHHADSGKYLNASRTMERCGSCASLVCGFVKSDTSLPSNIAQLLLAAILSDTHALERRAIATDHEAADRLSKLASIPKNEWHGMLKRISFAKSNMDGFSALEMLLKDYKGFGVAGISSMGRGLEDWTSAKEERLTEQVMEELRLSKKMQVMIVMTAFKDSETGAFRREILIHGDTVAARTLREQLGECAGMRLVPKTVNGVSNGTCFEQLNLEATRKITAPQVVLVLTRL